jgi:hypothetical protein
MVKCLDCGKDILPGEEWVKVETPEGVRSAHVTCEPTQEETYADPDNYGAGYEEGE